MHWVQQTIVDFGQQLGLARIDLGVDDGVRFCLASGTWLSVAPINRRNIDEILVCFSHPVGFDATRLRLTALQKAHRSNGGIHAVQIATRDNDSQVELLTLVRLPARGFTPQTLNHAVDYLDRWFVELKAGR